MSTPPLVLYFSCRSCLAHATTSFIEGGSLFAVRGRLS